MHYKMTSHDDWVTFIYMRAPAVPECEGRLVSCAALVCTGDRTRWHHACRMMTRLRQKWNHTWFKLMWHRRVTTFVALERERPIPNIWEHKAFRSESWTAWTVHMFVFCFRHTLLLLFRPGLHSSQVNYGYFHYGWPMFCSFFYISQFSTFPFEFACPKLN